MENKISYYRKLKGLTQSQLASILNFSNYQSLQAIEKGVNVPSVETALRIANALDTTVEKLFTIDEN